MRDFLFQGDSITDGMVEEEVETMNTRDTIISDLRDDTTMLEENKKIIIQLEL